MKEKIKELCSSIEKNISSKVNQVFFEYEKYWEDEDFNFSEYDYNLDSLYADLKNIDDSDIFAILETLINKYLEMMPKINVDNFREDFLDIDNYLEIFERGDKEHVATDGADFMVNSLIYKMNDDNAVDITLPLNMNYLVQYTFNPNLPKDKINIVMKKAVLKLIIVYKYFNSKTK